MGTVAFRPYTFVYKDQSKCTGNMSTRACINDRSGSLSKMAWASPLSSEGRRRVDDRVDTLFRNSSCSFDGAEDCDDTGASSELLNPRNSFSRLLVGGLLPTVADERLERNSRSSNVEAAGCSKGFTRPLEVQSN